MRPSTTTSIVISETKCYPEAPSASMSSGTRPRDSSLDQLKRTIGACLRLGRLHTAMAWAIFPAPAIYTVVVWFALHQDQLLGVGISRETIIWKCGNLLLRLVVVIMSYRSAGLAWDDLIDRSFDAKAARTKMRPLPAGDVSIDIACLYIAVQSFVTLVLIDLLLPGHLMKATLVGAAVFIPYPFLKRFTSLTQFFGAFLIAIGVLQGWAVCSSSPLAAQIGLEYGHNWNGFASLLLQSRDELPALLIMELLFELYMKEVLLKRSELIEHR
jgi:4-hydroxybenzoate polyprenyltransferase